MTKQSLPHTSPNETRQRLEKFLARCSVDELVAAMKADWLNAVFPGLRGLFDCDQGTKKHLEGSVGVHSALVFQNLLEVADRRLCRRPNFPEQLSALLHDLCKPETRTALPDGDVSFADHERRAAALIPPVAEKLGLSSAEAEQLAFLVGRHGEAHAWPKLSAAERADLTQSKWSESLAVLQEADAKSCLLPGGTHQPVFWDELTGR